MASISHVDDELFEGGGQAAVQPANGVHYQVSVAQHGRPETPHGLVGGLSVGQFGVGQAAAAPVRQVVAPGQLRPHQQRPGPFRRAKGRTAAPHIDIVVKPP